MTRLPCLFAAVAIAVLAARGADPAGAVVVRGKDTVVLQSELDATFAHYKAELSATGRTLLDDEMASVRAQLLDRIVLLHLCRARATPADLDRARRDSAAFIGRLKQEHGNDGFLRLINRAGYGEPDFATNKLAEAIVTAVIDREVKSAIRIPTADRRKFYDANPDRWVDPATVRIAWLPLSLVDLPKGVPLPPDVVSRKRALAVELRDRARRGEDFGALVRAYSDDLPAREAHGERVIARGQVATEIEEPAFRLEPGATSDPIEFAGGIGILKVLSRQLAGRMGFEQVDAQINELLVQRELPSRIAEFAARIRREAGIESVAPADGTGPRSR